MGSSHHLILGELQDFITGETLIKTHDELLRQEISHLLVEKCGFQKKEILPRQELLLTAGDEKAMIRIDYLVQLLNKTYMLIQYGPGDLVTRQRPALGMSRIVHNYQIPMVVVTNGRDADVMLGATGKVIGRGLDSIPSRTDLLKRFKEADFIGFPNKRVEMESRIVFAYESLGKCPCDTTGIRIL